MGVHAIQYNDDAAPFFAHRYGKSGSTGSKGGTWKIVDRTKPLTFVEVWYKDTPSMKLMGWDGVSGTTELLAPAQRAKREREEREEAIRKRGRKGNANSVGEDGGVVESDEEEEKEKAPPVVIVLSDDSDAE